MSSPVKAFQWRELSVVRRCKVSGQLSVVTRRVQLWGKRNVRDTASSVQHR
jgi:hypothetical protein